MVGAINTKSLVPRQALIMLDDLSIIPLGYIQEATLNGKYLKGIPLVTTNPGADVGSTTHTHNADGFHNHPTTVPNHTHGGESSGAPIFFTGPFDANLAPENHTHPQSTNTVGLALTDVDGQHTHDTFTNDIVHRTITFYKNNNSVIQMSLKSLPLNTILFYSKTGALPLGLLENLNYTNKHIKGDLTPGVNSGDNNHLHNSIDHAHAVSITPHEHSIIFGRTGFANIGGNEGGAQQPRSVENHDHTSGTAVSTGFSEIFVASGINGAHDHDNIDHEPPFKTVRLLKVNVVQMSNAGVPKNCLLLWINSLTDLSSLAAGWQISDGTNGTINLLDLYPKVNTTPELTGGAITHIHNSELIHNHTAPNTITHGHSGATGVSGTDGALKEDQQSLPFESSILHTHTPGPPTMGPNQTPTINNTASTHNHGTISNDPLSKLVGFIQRIAG